MGIELQVINTSVPEQIPLVFEFDVWIVLYDIFFAGNESLSAKIAGCLA